MMDKNIIRKATIKDLADIQRLNLDLFKKECREFDENLNLKWTYSNDGKKYFSWRISKKDGFVEVAECSNKIVGYIVGGL